MANIPKIMRTLVITTVAGGTFTVEDTDECMMASQTLTALKQGGWATFLIDGNEVQMPSSAVDHIEITTTTKEVEIPESGC